MIEFHTLGGLDLRDSDGTKLSVVLVHPKRVALLVYLAIATPRGFHRRDTLLALFWPELDQEHARASLRKAVHHLRRAVGQDVLLGRGDEELGLAQERLWCDATAFDEAIDSDDAAKAMQLYTGPLLNGFFISDTPEFERWLEHERGRLRDRACLAAWRLAVQEERANSAVGAALWGRRAAALLPDDEEALRRLLKLLHRLGDRAGALKAYEEFARRLKQDYDADPSEETRSLVRAIRTSQPAQSAEAQPVAAVTPSVQALPLAETASDAQAAPPATKLAHRRAALFQGRHRRTRAVLWMVAALVVFGGTWQALSRDSTTAASPSAASVAVLPFAFRGAPEYAYLGEGIASLLGTSLDEAGESQSVDPNALLAFSKLPNRTVLDPATAAVLAARFGARRYILGDILEAGGRLRVTATLYDTQRGDKALARATSEDTAIHLFALVDRLAAQLVAQQRTELGGRLTRLAAMTTHSLPALKAYLEGEQQFRTGHYKEAVDAFQRAVAEDSSFALAYYRLALAYGWSSDTMGRPMILRAIHFSERLSTQDRTLVEAYLPYNNGEADEAERRYRAILSTRPFEGEAWYPLGEVLFHFNPVRGRSITEARPIFERALTLGPRDAPLTHLLEIEGIDGNYATFDSLLHAIAPGAHFDLVGRTVRALMHGSESERTRLLEEIRRTPDPELANTARHMLFLVSDRLQGERVIRLLLESARPREVQALGHILLAHLEMSGGRWRAANAALQSAEQLDRARALEHRGLLHALPFIPLSRSDIEATHAALELWDADSASASALVFPGDQQLHRHFRTYLLGLLSARLGDHEAARHFAADAERLPGTADAQGLAAALAHGVRARIAWERSKPADALGELRQTRVERAAADLLGVVPFYSTPQERFLRALALQSLGRYEEALGWYSSFGEHSAFGRVFLAPAHRSQGEIHEKMGRRAEALRSYSRFIEMWRDCDPELRPLVIDAQARLQRLQSSLRDSR